MVLGRHLCVRTMVDRHIRSGIPSRKETTEGPSASLDQAVHISPLGIMYRAMYSFVSVMPVDKRGKFSPAPRDEQDPLGCPPQLSI